MDNDNGYTELNGSSGVDYEVCSDSYNANREEIVSLAEINNFSMSFNYYEGTATRKYISTFYTNDSFSDLRAPIQIICTATDYYSDTGPEDRGSILVEWKGHITESQVTGLKSEIRSIGKLASSIMNDSGEMWDTMPLFLI